MALALRPALALAALSAVGLIAPALGTGAVAGIQDDRLNTATLGQIEPRLDLIQQSGARVTRVDMFWSEVAPTKPANPDDPFDPAYQFAKFDAIFTGLRVRGITPIVTVYSAPRWATGGKGPLKGRQNNANMPNPVQFGRFMGAVATRYNGSFDGGQYSIARPLVRHFEIWNEPNLSRYLVPQFDKRGRALSTRNYVTLVRAAYGRIKKANPRAVVIAGVAGPKSTTKKKGALDDLGFGALDWLKGLRQFKRTLKFDAYSQHIYPALPPTAKAVVYPNWASVPPLFKEIDKFKRGLPLYITEAGYTTQITPIRLTVVSISQQAKYLRQIFALKSIKNKRVPVVIWFNLQDNPVWPGGLQRQTGSNKPSFSVFRTIAGRGPLPSALALP